jgi:ATP-dependent protease ClpP protease subunit
MKKGNKERTMNNRRTSRFRNSLQQLLADNSRNAAKDYRVVDKGETAEMFLYGAIGDMYDGIRADDFVKDLRAIEAPVVHMYVNSPGGDVFEARAMATHMMESNKTIHFHIDALCASAMTYVAMQATTRDIAPGGFFMIHEAWTFDIGNKRDLRETADLLDKIDVTIAEDLHKGTGVPMADIVAMMAATTWMSAEKTVELGFVDSIRGEARKAENKWNLSAYDNAPEDLVKQFENNLDQEDKSCYDRARFERRLALVESFR